MSAALSGPQKSVENRFFTKKNEAKDDQTVFYMTEMREWSGFHTRCNKSWWIGRYSSRTHWTGALNTFVGLICLHNMGVLCMCKGQMCLRESWLYSCLRCRTGRCMCREAHIQKGPRLIRIHPEQTHRSSRYRSMTSTADLWWVKFITAWQDRK